MTSATVFSVGGMLSYATEGRVGFAVRSLGSSATNRDLGTRYAVPTRVRVGAAQGFHLAGQRFRAALDAEFRVRQHAAADVHLGAEWDAMSMLAFRVGYESLANPDVAGRRDTRWSAGTGIDIGPTTLGIAARFGGLSGSQELFVGLDAF